MKMDGSGDQFVYGGIPRPSCTINCVHQRKRL